MIVLYRFYAEENHTWVHYAYIFNATQDHMNPELVAKIHEKIKESLLESACASVLLRNIELEQLEYYNNSQTAFAYRTVDGNGGVYNRARLTVFEIN